MVCMKQGRDDEDGTSGRQNASGTILATPPNPRQRRG